MTLTKKPSSYISLFRPKSVRAVTTCTLQQQEQHCTSSSSSSDDHKALCFSLTTQLINRGLLSSAKKVIQRMIGQSLSVSDAVMVFDFAAMKGIKLDVNCYAVLMRKLVKFRQPHLVESLYYDCVVNKGLKPDLSVLDSVVFSLSQLGKLDVAKAVFDTVLGSGCVPRGVACDKFVKLLVKEGRVLEGFDYFLSVCDVGGGSRELLSALCLNNLVSGLCEQGYLGEALKVFDVWRKESESPPTMNLYKRLFYGLCKRGWAVEAELVSGEMEGRGYFVDKKMYTSLINGYCKDKKMRMAMRVYLRMLKTGCELDNYVYNTLIHGFAKMGLFDKGWLLYNEMTNRGFQPDMVTYLVIVNNYCKGGELECAMTLVDNMKRSELDPTIHCYTALISALYKESRLSEVEQVYRSMLTRGIVPDHVLCFTLLKRHPKGHELQLAHIILQGIAINGCGIDPSMLPVASSSPSPREFLREIELLLDEIARSDLNLANDAFGIYISALCEGGNTDAALCCLDKLVKLGCRPLVFTYNSLIKSLCRSGLFEDAKCLIDFMEDSGIVPNLHTFLIMVNELCKLGDLESAFEVFDSINQRGLKPNVSIYDSIITRLSRQGRVSEAEDWFVRMLEDGIDPDEVVYMTMINCYARNGRATEARQLFHMMTENGVQPSLYSYTALISALVKKDMTDKGCMYLDRMLDDGFEPNSVLYTNLVSHFLRKGEFEFAFRLVDLMDRNQVPYDLVTYIALSSGVSKNITGSKKWHINDRKTDRAREMLFHLLNQGSHMPMGSNIEDLISSPRRMRSFALKLIDRLKELRFMPNLYLYNCIIYGFCKAGKMNDAFDHLKMMCRDGIQPNRVTFTILIDACISIGEINHAIELFNRMRASGCLPDRAAYNTLMKGLCRSGKLVDALSLSYTMQKRGIIPSKACHEYLFHAFCANGLGIAAVKLFEEMFSHGYIPRRYYCAWLLCILRDERRVEEAHLILNMMHMKGKLPNGFARRLLQENWQKHG